MGYGIRRYKLEGVVFIVGAVTMALEMTGTRLLGPYIGTSIYVWTSLIGVILGSLSIGYFFGGKLADANPQEQFLSWIILFASVCVAGIAIVFKPVSAFADFFPRDIRLSSTIVALILFSPASILLGMVSPYAIRLRMKDLKRSGETSGILYAISSVGSILGTFCTGFFLLSALGSTMILFFISGTLLMTSFLYSRKIAPVLYFLVAGIMVLLILSVWFDTAEAEKQGVIHVDTQYNHIQIVTRGDRYTGGVRFLRINNEFSSAAYLGRSELVWDYTKFYDIFLLFHPNISRALMIGGAGYTYPMHFVERFPRAKLDVVEIDPQLAGLAKVYFSLSDTPRLTKITQDARVFLNQYHGPKYDVIFGDAFSSLYTIPYQLTTREAVSRMHDLLTNDGVVVINIIGSLDGENAQFLKAEYNTFSVVFPQVYLFPVQNPAMKIGMQNIMLVAMKAQSRQEFHTQDPELSWFVRHLYAGQLRSDLPVLTDDFAPVERYMAASIMHWRER